MKIVVTAIGVGLKYRLDLIKRAMPDIIKDYMIVLTDEYSLSLYKDYYDTFTFVTIDEIRKNYPISLEYENFLNVPTEEEFWVNVKQFYNGRTRKNFYPYDVHRFILPWMAEQNILNFAIIDSDMMFVNSPSTIKRFFESIPSGSVYMPMFGNDNNDNKNIREQFIKEYVAPSFSQFDYNKESIKVADGFVRGFHFKSKEDIMLFFNFWNKTVEEIFSGKSETIGVGGNVILDLYWVCPYMMDYFSSYGYSFKDHNEFQYMDNKNTYCHVTRPDDTFYFGERSNWDYHNFDYSDVSTVAGFIKNNRKQLENYYAGRLDIIEITDTHCYTKMRDE